MLVRKAVINHLNHTHRITIETCRGGYPFWFGIWTMDGELLHGGYGETIGETASNAWDAMLNSDKCDL